MDQMFQKEIEARPKDMMILQIWPPRETTKRASPYSTSFIRDKLFLGCRFCINSSKFRLKELKHFPLWITPWGLVGMDIDVFNLQLIHGSFKLFSEVRMVYEFTWRGIARRYNIRFTLDHIQRGIVGCQVSDRGRFIIQLLFFVRWV